MIILVDSLVASSVSSAGDVFQVDFDLILENISVLNSVAGEGQAKVQHTTGGARLKVRQYAHT